MVKSPETLYQSKSPFLLFPNGLQVNGGVYYRKFTKSLIFRDFDDVLKNLFRYVYLFLSLNLLSKSVSKIAMYDL